MNKYVLPIILELFIYIFNYKNVSLQHDIENSKIKKKKNEYKINVHKYILY